MTVPCRSCHSSMRLTPSSSRSAPHPSPLRSRWLMCLRPPHQLRLPRPPGSPPSSGGTNVSALPGGPCALHQASERVAGHHRTAVGLRRVPRRRLPAAAARPVRSLRRERRVRCFRVAVAHLHHLRRWSGVHIAPATSVSTSVQAPALGVHQNPPSAGSLSLSHTSCVPLEERSGLIHSSAIAARSAATAESLADRTVSTSPARAATQQTTSPAACATLRNSPNRRRPSPSRRSRSAKNHQATEVAPSTAIGSGDRARRSGSMHANAGQLTRTVPADSHRRA